MSEKDNLQEADGLTENNSEANAMTPDEVKTTNLEATNATPKTTEASEIEESVTMPAETEETKFLRIGKAQGAQICNGYDMLIQQAEKAWDIWGKYN